MNIKNQFNIPVATMQRVLDVHFMRKMTVLVEKLLETHHGTHFPTTNPYLSKPGEDNPYLNSRICLSEQRQIVRQKIQSLAIAAVACIFIANVRILGRKAHFVGARCELSSMFIANELFGEVPPVFISSEHVTDKIVELLSATVLYDDQDPKKFFTVRKSLSTPGQESNEGEEIGASN